MKAISLHTLAEFCDGKLIVGCDSEIASRVNTDSRNIQPGDVFFALKGEKFDAHDFIPQVAQAGAAAVIVSRPPEVPVSTGCAVILVEDTLVAMQNLARHQRRLMNPLVIGITGSNGKTSTKDFTAAVLSSQYSVCATAGNLNNHIGLPLTILGMSEDQNCAVLEMGMNHAGEIAILVSVAEPNAAIITNIGVAHIEHLGSREAIALEKGTLAEAVPAGGVVVLNANDEFTPTIQSRCRATVLTAGVNCGDVKATIHESTAQGSRFSLDFVGTSRIDAFLPFPGEHMVANAALAAACAWHHGVSPEAIVSGLGQAKLTKGRVQLKTVRGIIFLDDSYNANPDSMRAGIRTLAEMKTPGRRIAVLGRMGELGAHAGQGHREVGVFAARSGLDAIFTVGDEAAQINDAASAERPDMTTKNFADCLQCAAALRQWLHTGDAVLLKGSRSAGMEQVLAHLETS